MKKILLFTVIIFITACNIRKDKSISLSGNWVELSGHDMSSVKGITLNNDGSASSIGSQSLLYDRWKQESNRLILYGTDIENRLTADFCDTLYIIKQTPDTIITENKNKEKHIYVRTENIYQTENKINITDSLVIHEGAGDVICDTYKGILPAASCTGIEYIITIYHQKASGDGVFHAKLNYLDAENGNDKCFNIYGRQYTLRGDSNNKNSTVIQLVSFNDDEIMNFIKHNDKITMLDRELKEIKSDLNYSLKKTD